MDMPRNGIDAKWKWLPALGSLLVVLGMFALANLRAATAVPVHIIAITCWWDQWRNL